MDSSILINIIVISEKKGNLIFWHKITESINTHTLLVDFHETYFHLQKYFSSILNTKVY